MIMDTVAESFLAINEFTVGKRSTVYKSDNTESPSTTMTLDHAPLSLRIFTVPTLAVLINPYRRTICTEFQRELSFFFLFSRERERERESEREKQGTLSERKKLKPRTSLEFCSPANIPVSRAKVNSNVRLVPGTGIMQNRFSKRYNSEGTYEPEWITGATKLEVHCLVPDERVSLAQV